MPSRNRPPAFGQPGEPADQSSDREGPIDRGPQPGRNFVIHRAGNAFLPPPMNVSFEPSSIFAPQVIASPLRAAGQAADEDIGRALGHERGGAVLVADNLG